MLVNLSWVGYAALSGNVWLSWVVVLQLLPEVLPAAGMQMAGTVVPEYAVFVWTGKTGLLLRTRDKRD